MSWFYYYFIVHPHAPSMTALKRVLESKHNVVKTIQWQFPAPQPSCRIAHLLAEEIKSFCGVEFVNKMFATHTARDKSGKRKCFSNSSLSRATVTRRCENRAVTYVTQKQSNII
jgi:hypothetical protein